MIGTMPRRPLRDDGEPVALPIRSRTPRKPLRQRGSEPAGSELAGMSHDQLVAALREVEGLRDVGDDDHPNLRFRGRPFLHFHDRDGRTYADVRFGGGDFEPVWASTPQERAELLARVRRHVTRVGRTRKSGRPSR
jgi:hypothetical protein